MGEKLKLDKNDPFLRGVFSSPVGLSGGCYCCGKQIHIGFENIDVLPTAKINRLPYHVLVCDDCEEDLATLEQSTEEEVTFDTLFFIQEDLNDELVNLDIAKGGYSEEDRNKVLKRVYKKYSKHIKG